MNWLKEVFITNFASILVLVLAIWVIIESLWLYWWHPDQSWNQPQMGPCGITSSLDNLNPECGIQISLSQKDVHAPMLLPCQIGQVKTDKIISFQSFSHPGLDKDWCFFTLKLAWHAQGPNEVWFNETRWTLLELWLRRRRLPHHSLWTSGRPSTLLKNGSFMANRQSGCKNGIVMIDHSCCGHENTAGAKKTMLCAHQVHHKFQLVTGFCWGACVSVFGTAHFRHENRNITRRALLCLTCVSWQTDDVKSKRRYDSEGGIKFSEPKQLETTFHAHNKRQTSEHVRCREMSDRNVTGKCLCGSIQFVVTPTDYHTHACHCSMCRRWSSGSPTFTVGCTGPPEVLQGEQNLTTYQSSEYGERSFCKVCGSNLFHGAPSFGYYGVSAGVFDEDSDLVQKLTMDQELFIDKKPAYYGLEDMKQTKMTEAEFLAMIHSGGDDGEGGGADGGGGGEDWKWWRDKKKQSQLYIKNLKSFETKKTKRGRGGLSWTWNCLSSTLDFTSVFFVLRSCSFVWLLLGMSDGVPRLGSKFLGTSVAAYCCPAPTHPQPSWKRATLPNPNSTQPPGRFRTWGDVLLGMSTVARKNQFQNYFFIQVLTLIYHPTNQQSCESTGTSSNFSPTQDGGTNSGFFFGFSPQHSGPMEI